MKNPVLQQTVDQAIAAGLLPPSATPPVHAAFPWPVLLLSAIGAWLAALPLFGFVALVGKEMLLKGLAPYISGLLLLAATIAVLRLGAWPRFAEQIALPALLVALGLLAFGLSRDRVAPFEGAGALCLLTLAIAALAGRRWLQVVLGAISSALAAFCLYAQDDRWGSPGAAYWFAWTGNLALLLLIRYLQEGVLVEGKLVRLAAVLETIGTGWTAVTLAALAIGSGRTFMLDAILATSPFDDYDNLNVAIVGLERLTSLTLGVVAAIWLAWRWPSLRRPWIGGVSLILTLLAWFAPFLGAALLLTAHSATRGHWRLAGAGALVVIWIIGSMYYALAFPLAIKAVLLGATGALMGALAWRAVAPASPVRLAPRMPKARPAPRLRLGVAASLLVTLAIANTGIWRNEQLISHGTPTYIEIAPRDPRSLMQGDYMALRVNIPSGVELSDSTFDAPFVIAKRDNNGVATVLRAMTAGGALAADEFPIELSHNARGWVIVSDAWYFKEGDAERWSTAHYGEYRISANGKALLVGLRDVQLRAL